LRKRKCKIKNGKGKKYHWQIKKDKKTGADIFQTHILKFSGDKFPEKIVDGNNSIIGEHQGNLYLFNIDDYRVTVVNLLEWKVKK